MLAGNGIAGVWCQPYHLCQYDRANHRLTSDFFVQPLCHHWLEIRGGATIPRIYIWHCPSSRRHPPPTHPDRGTNIHCVTCSVRLIISGIWWWWRRRIRKTFPRIHPRYLHNSVGWSEPRRLYEPLCSEPPCSGHNRAGSSTSSFSDYTGKYKPIQLRKRIPVETNADHGSYRFTSSHACHRIT